MNPSPETTANPEVFDPHLKPGEQILWFGSPTKSFWGGWPRVALPKAVILIWLGIAGLGVVGHILDGPGMGSGQGSVLGLLMAFGWGYFLYWLYFGRERDHRMRSHYAITDRRVLMLVHRAEDKLTFYDLKPNSVFLLEGTTGIIVADPNSYRTSKRGSMEILTNHRPPGPTGLMRLTGLEAPVRLLPILREAAGQDR